ncbi:MAG: hypothetical protein ACJAZW_001715 [Maritalea sp.]|jgi:hypothetical protein
MQGNSLCHATVAKDFRRERALLANQKLTQGRQKVKVDCCSSGVSFSRGVSV